MPPPLPLQAQAAASPPAPFDAKRIVLWGTSFAGGHVLVTAARFGHNISAVISQVPHLSGPQASKVNIVRRGLPCTLRMVAAALNDALRSLLRLPPAYVKLAGGRDELSIMQASCLRTEGGCRAMWQAFCVFKGWR